MDYLHNNSFNNATSATEGRLRFRDKLMLWSLCAVGAFAFAEHCMILLLTFLNKTLRQKPYIAAILLLWTSDILISMSLFLVSLTNLVPLQQTWVCGFSIFLTQVGYVTSLVHTLIICTERYLCMRPVRVEMLSLRKRQALTMINICFCSVILGIPFIFSSRKTTIVFCNLSVLYEDKLTYVLIPIRSLTLLLWLGNILVYAITFKNFQDIRRMDRFDTKHDVASTSFALPKAVVKSTENRQSELDSISSMSCTILGENTSREDKGLVSEMKIQNLPARSRNTIIGDEPKTTKYATGEGDRTFEVEPLEYEKKVMQDNKNLNCTFSQFEWDTISSLSTANLPLNRPEKGKELYLEMKTLHSGAQVTVSGIDTDKAKYTAGACARTRNDAALVSTNRICQDTKDINIPMNVHYRVRTEHITGTKTYIAPDETGDFRRKSVKQNNRRRHLSQESSSTNSNLPQRRQTREKMGRISLTSRDNRLIRAFKIVSVVFVVFLITMTPQCLIGFAMIFCPIPEIVYFSCAILVSFSIVLNPVIYVLLLKEFREVVLICK